MMQTHTHTHTDEYTHIRTILTVVVFEVFFADSSRSTRRLRQLVASFPHRHFEHLFEAFQPSVSAIQDQDWEYREKTWPITSTSCWTTDRLPYPAYEVTEEATELK